MDVKQCEDRERPNSGLPRSWSVERVLSVDPESVVVDSGGVTEVGPHSNNVFSVVLERYRDLQLLGIVPRDLEEDVFTDAVRADDAAVLEHILAHPEQDSNCQCHSETALARESAMRRQYETVRKSFNPKLAEVMSKAARVRFDWDAALVGVARKRYLSLALKPEILVLLARDIRINRSSTMMLDKQTRLLLAHNIYIHDSGTLATRGGYLRIWANSVSRWNELTPIAIHPVDRPVWALT